MVGITKPINGISLNGDESLLDENNEVMKFVDKESAKDFLRQNGFDLSDEELEDSFGFPEL